MGVILGCVVVSQLYCKVNSVVNVAYHIWFVLHYCEYKVDYKRLGVLIGILFESYLDIMRTEGGNGIGILP